jgi:homospermidine synthase
MRDITPHIKVHMNKYPANIEFRQQHITKQNYKSVLDFITPNTVVIDVSYDIGTNELLAFMYTKHAMYFNMSVEEFDPLSANHSTPQDYTLYARHQLIRAEARKHTPQNPHPTCVIAEGMNPGVVSALVKKCMVKIVDDIRDGPLKAQLISLIRNGHFKQLGQALGVKVIHITEQDTQVSNKPRQPDEYCNTWSPHALVEEATSCVETGWGTHERTLPDTAYEHSSGERNQICLSTRGCNLDYKSFSYYGPFIGMHVRHDEAYSISSRFSVYRNEQPRNYVHDPLRHIDPTTPCEFRPTVGFVYKPCDAGVNSIMRSKEVDYKIDDSKCRLLFTDVTEGKDIIGVTLYTARHGIYWCGSLLDIEETRRLIDIPNYDINATGITAACSILSAAIYAIRHPNLGLLMPDDLDYKEYLSIVEPVLGPIINQRLTDKQISETEWKKIKELQFGDFVHQATLTPS